MARSVSGVIISSVPSGTSPRRPSPKAPIDLDGSLAVSCAAARSPKTNATVTTRAMKPRQADGEILGVPLPPLVWGGVGVGGQPRRAEFGVNRIRSLRTGLKPDRMANINSLLPDELALADR